MSIENLHAVRMHLEAAHRSLDLAKGPSGARAALHEITEAIRVIDGKSAKPGLSDQVRSFIEGMSVSVDVSTGDHDAGHRYFGTVSEVMDDPHDKHGVTLLVQNAVPNFKPEAAQAGKTEIPTNFIHSIRVYGDARQDGSPTVIRKAFGEVITELRMLLAKKSGGES